MNNCRNCGAPIDPRKTLCPYCDTYLNESASLPSVVDTARIGAALSAGMVTVNEARSMAGLPPVPDRAALREQIVEQITNGLRRAKP